MFPVDHINQVLMSVFDKPSSSSAISSSQSVSARDIDPLLKDLNEKKQSFRRNVVSLAAELKEVRSRLASQEQSFAKETLTRQVYHFWVWVLFVQILCYLDLMIVLFFESF